MGNPSCRGIDPFWSQERLDALVHQVRKVLGLDLSPFDRTFLVRALSARAIALAETPQSYGERLATDAPKAQELRQSL